MNSKYNLNYPTGDDYYDINIFNNNFSNLADGIDDAKAGGFKGEVIIAAHNSKNPLKSCADFVCGTSDCTDVLKSAVDKAIVGGKIRFLDGDYYIENEWIINKSVHIYGESKFSSIIHKNGLLSKNIAINAIKCSITNMGFITDNNLANQTFLKLANDLIDIDNCYFKQIYKSNTDAAAISINNTGAFYNTVKNCLFEKYSGVRFVVNAVDSLWAGVMTGNYVRNPDTREQLAVGVNLQNTTSLNNIDFGSQETAIYIKGTILS